MTAPDLMVNAFTWHALNAQRGIYLL